MTTRLQVYAVIYHHFEERDANGRVFENRAVLVDGTEPGETIDALVKRVRPLLENIEAEDRRDLP